MIMKRAFNLLFFVLLAIAAQGQAKYVFYFIGDGMGLNHVNGTEMYLAALQDGRIGREPLRFTQFPVGSMATTFSASNPVTDSSAAGTALATGVKTKNGVIGMDKDLNPVNSVAHRAKNTGKKVGVATSVSVDHATPAAFYAHQPRRNYYYEIANDLIASDFDFYAGAGFLKPETTFDKKDAPNIFTLFDESDYTVSYGYTDYNGKKGDAKKMILIQPDEKDKYSLPYAIDRDEDDLTLPQITEAAIDFLYKGKGKSNGFFLMVEGGKIDWSSHSNDAATTFQEVIDFDLAIQEAYQFYLKHPKETLIIVTADHETGGLSLGGNRYNMELSVLQHQLPSVDKLSNMLTNLRKQENVTWEDIKQLLASQMGFWTELPISWDQEKRLRDEYELTFVNHKEGFEESLYSRTEPLAARAKEIMNEMAMVGWAHGSHTAGYVPVYAIGPGSELFTGVMDISDIPMKISKAARYK